MKSSCPLRVNIEDLSVNKKSERSKTMKALSGPLLKLFKSDHLLDPDSCTVIALGLEKDYFWEKLLSEKAEKQKTFFKQEKLRDGERLLIKYSFINKVF